MESIEERAEDYSNIAQFGKGWQDVAKEGYIRGAIEQKEIDTEKACEWFRQENSHAVTQWLDYECEKLRKAMEG